MQIKHTKARLYLPSDFLKAVKLSNVMSYRLFGSLWLALPSWVRRFVLRRVQTTFTVSAADVVPLRGQMQHSDIANIDAGLFL